MWSCSTLFLLVSESPHAEVLYLDLRSPLDSQLFQYPWSLLLSIWELLGLSAPTVRSYWPGPCLIILIFPAPCKLLGALQTLLYSTRTYRTVWCGGLLSGAVAWGSGLLMSSYIVLRSVELCISTGLWFAEWYSIE